MLLFILLPLLKGLLDPCLFCLTVSIVCLQLKGNLIFYLSNVHLVFSRRPSFFLSSPALLQEIGCMSTSPFLEKGFLPLLVTWRCWWGGPAICLFRERWWWRVSFLYCEIGTHLHPCNEISIFCVMPGTVLNCPLVMCYPWDDNLSYFFVNLYTANNKLNIIIWV